MELNEKLLPKYKSGDVIELGGTSWANQVIFPGFITSSTKSVLFEIKTDKSLKNITSITCQSLKIEIRTISGYINSTSGYIEYVNNASYSIDAYVIDEHTIEIIITKSSAFTNVTNNTCLSIDGYIKLKLN